MPTDTTQREEADVVDRMRAGAVAGELDIGEAWNLLDEGADAIDKLRAEVERERRRADCAEKVETTMNICFIRGRDACLDADGGAMPASPYMEESDEMQWWGRGYSYAHRLMRAQSAERERDEMRKRLDEAPVGIMDTRDVLGICAPTEDDFPALHALRGKRVRLVVEDGP